jgi:predicted transcriptional regulator
MLVRLARQSRGAVWSSIADPLLRAAGIVLALLMLLAAMGLVDAASPGTSTAATAAQHAQHRCASIARW